MLDTEKLSPGLRFLSLRDVKAYFNLRDEDTARKLCVEHLDLGIFLYNRVVPATERCKAVEIAEEKVLAIALEMAMFAHLLPHGPGINLNNPPHAQTLPDAVRSNEAFRVPDYWYALRADPHKLQLMVALAATLYGPFDDKALHNRLSALGDLLLTKAVRIAKKKGTL